MRVILALLLCAAIPAHGAQKKRKITLKQFLNWRERIVVKHLQCRLRMKKAHACIKKFSHQAQEGKEFANSSIQKVLQDHIDWLAILHREHFTKHPQKQSGNRPSPLKKHKH